ncbi:MAG: hypothetical protein ABIR97_00545 [Terracoccus sp.]
MVQTSSLPREGRFAGVVNLPPTSWPAQMIGWAGPRGDRTLLRHGIRSDRSGPPSWPTRTSCAEDVEALSGDSTASVRAAAAASRRLTFDTLTRLAQDRSAQVRWHVLTMNPERLDLAATIARDSDETNAHQARRQLADPRHFTEFLGDVDLVH